MLNVPYLVVIVIIAYSLYGIACKRNLIKIILCVDLLSDAVNVFLIALDYRYKGIPPIITSEASRNLRWFSLTAVDPLPQALVLTAIVIDMCVLAMAISIAINIYEKYGTLDPRKIRRLAG